MNQESVIKMFIVGPELLALIFLIASSARSPAPDLEINRRVDEYVGSEVEHEKLDNLKRSLHRQMKFVELKRDFLIPGLIAISSLLAGIAETGSQYIGVFTALIFVGIVLVAVDYAWSLRLTEHNYRLARSIHLFLSGSFILATATAKLLCLLLGEH